jgi:predicted nucleotidyltransferase
MPDEPIRVRKLTHEQASVEQLLYWRTTYRGTCSDQASLPDERQVAILAALLHHGVEFVVVGGLAVNAHGYVRESSDMDLFVRTTDENIGAAYDAFRAVEVLNRIDIVLVGEEPSLRLFPADEDHVDTLPWIGDIGFDQVWRNRVEAKMKGLTVPFISKADLIESKRQTGRLRDLADVEELERIPDDSL